MKFCVQLSDENSKVLWIASGFTDLEDATVAAVALAQRRRGQDFFVWIRSAGKVLFGSQHNFGGICCESLQNYPLSYVQANAHKAMEDLKRKQREIRARHKFLKAHGGYDGEFYKTMMPPHNLSLPPGQSMAGDDILRQRFFSNDFAGALARFEELKKVQVAA